MVLFNAVPGNYRTPGWIAEINPAQSPYQSNSRLLYIGQMFSTGKATPGEAIQIIQNSGDLFGAGSMLDDMFRIGAKSAPFQEIWALPMLDDGAGVAATGSILCGGLPVAASSSFSIWIGGEEVRTSVLITDTAATLAARIVDDINDTTYVPVIASVNGVTPAQIDLVAKHAGTAGNSIQIVLDFYRTETFSSASILTVTQMTGGSGDPSFATALSALGDEEFDFIAGPYADTTFLNAVRDFLDGTSGRWSPFQMLYGSYWTTRRDDHATVQVFGSGRNDPHATIMGSYDSPSSSWRWAAALGARAAFHLQSAPELNRPLKGLTLEGILPPKNVASRPNKLTRNSLYFKGISSYTVTRDGEVVVDLAITTYQLNSNGNKDASFLSVNTLAQNVFNTRYLRTKVEGQWGRHALADENPGNIQGICTPADIRDTILHGYRELQDNYGTVENFDLFAASLIVERNKQYADRVDVYLPEDVTNQLNVIAVNITSFLQFSA